ncbi:MAG: 50S ribosomal protein L3 N(5)-glutamine methyltransferase [Steroidobacteraceae bacterium]
MASLLARSTRRLARARLHYGHGTDNARDEAAALIWHALRLPHTDEAGALRALLARPVAPGALARVEALLLRRIRDRIPASYLTRRCWFAGLALYVDERVLIPRSPIAELIEQRFAPWIALARVQRILDLGTGSGCIAIACARAFTRARIDALDISSDALQVARRNIRRHRLGRRVRALQSDYFTALRSASYDIIVSNPPYVGRRELRGLPPEYRHEPQLALAAGADGLDAVRIILRDAAAHLNPGGILIVEVGNSEAALRRAFPRLPFIWLSFERGGGGVFVLERAQLAHSRSPRSLGMRA